MMPAITQTALDDLICVWLDGAIPALERLEFLRWPQEKDISIPEALRTNLFYAIKRAIENGETQRPSRKTAIKFPSSVISRVQNAISHLEARCTDEEVVPRSIVFIPTTVAQLAQQIPVAQTLHELSKSYCFLFQTPKWAHELDLTGVEIAPHTRFLQSELLSARLRARVLWLRLGREQTLGLPHFCFEQRTFDLNHVLIDAFSSSITSVFEAHALAKYLVDYLRPKLIVVGNDLTVLGRVVTSCAKRYGISSVGLLDQVQDAPIDAYRLSDRFVVYGNYSKRLLASAGIDTKKIKACGTPYLDALATHKPLSFMTREEAVATKNVTFVLADLSPKWAQMLSRIAKASPQLFILFLTHGKRSIKEFQGLSGQSGNFRLCLKSELSGGKYAACLKSADRIVTSTFKTAVEAIGLGKNVVAMNLEGEFSNLEFLKAGVTPVANDEESLSQILREAPLSNADTGSDNNQRKFLEDYFYRRDGMSSQRIAQVIIATSINR